MNGGQGGLRVVALDGQGSSGMRPLKDYEAAILLMSLRVFLAGGMIADKIHERQRVVGIGHGPGEVPQGQPADAPVIILNELAIGLLALFLAQDKHLPASIRQAGLMPQIVEVGWEA